MWYRCSHYAYPSTLPLSIPPGCQGRCKSSSLKGNIGAKLEVCSSEVFLHANCKCARSDVHLAARFRTRLRRAHLRLRLACLRCFLLFRFLAIDTITATPRLPAL